MILSKLTRRIFLQRTAMAGAAAASVGVLPGCAIRSSAPAADGFRALFDGKTLRGWRGEPGLWSVEDAAITGKAATPLPRNTFLICDGVFRDFELRLKYRFLSKTGNSGIQYRSTVLDEDKFLVGGYQANMVTTETEQRFGFLYDEGGRAELAFLGERVRVERQGGKISRHVTGSVNTPAEILSAVKLYPEWNDYVVIAFGTRLIQAVNRFVTVEVLDNDPERAMAGIIALQLHGGMAMGVQAKDVQIKELRAEPALAGRFKTRR